MKKLEEIKETIKTKLKKRKKLSKEQLEQKQYLNNLKKLNSPFFDDVIGSKKGKLKKFSMSRIGTAQLFEKIGTSEVYDKAYPILANDDVELGSYIVMQLAINKFIFLDNITPDDWTPTRDNNIKKLLDIVKFANDDYRVRAKIKGETFYTKKPVYKKQIFQQEMQTENGIEKVDIEDYVLDDDGNPEIDYYDEIFWEEPKAVTQSGREAIRIGNAYKIRMQKKREAKETLWSKYGMQIMMVFMVVMICGTWYLTAKMQTSSMGDEWEKLRDERGKGIINPEAFAQKVVEKQQEIEAHENAPPK
jgi:hypothetical protein